MSLNQLAIAKTFNVANFEGKFDIKKVLLRLNKDSKK